jgi:hypothetical protein
MQMPDDPMPKFPIPPVPTDSSDEDPGAFRTESWLNDEPHPTDRLLAPLSDLDGLPLIGLQDLDVDGGQDDGDQK